MKETFKDMSFKDKSALISAWIAFVIGWTITVAGFIVDPLGTIADSVLWTLGQALIYAASVFGVTAYFAVSLKKSKAELASFVNEQISKATNKEEEAED